MTETKEQLIARLENEIEKLLLERPEFRAYNESLKLKLGQLEDSDDKAALIIHEVNKLNERLDEAMGLLKKD